MTNPGKQPFSWKLISLDSCMTVMNDKIVKRESPGKGEGMFALEQIQEGIGY